MAHKPATPEKRRAASKVAGFAVAFLFAWWRIFVPTRYEQTLLGALGRR